MDSCQTIASLSRLCICFAMTSKFSSSCVLRERSCCKTLDHCRSALRAWLTNSFPTCAPSEQNKCLQGQSLMLPRNRKFQEVFMPKVNYYRQFARQFYLSFQVTKIKLVKNIASVYLWLLKLSCIVERKKSMWLSSKNLFPGIG